MAGFPTAFTKSRPRWLAIFLGLSSAWLASAQPVPVSELHLTARTRAGQTTFRIGEAIPLDLIFSCDVAQKYQLNVANYDRSGRTNYENFQVEPRAGWTDPLDLYFRSGGPMSGGGAALQPLSTAPIALPMELNEWVRFDQPGEYRLTIRSSRVAAPPQRIVPLASNELHLTIVAATPEWQQETLQNALTNINTSAGHMAAVKTLRYLGTEGAAREMARRSQENDCRLGLFGSPFRTAGRDEMRKFLRDPNVMIDRQFLETLALLSVPDTPGQHYQDPQEILNRLQQDLAAAIPTKKGIALTQSVQTLLESPRGVSPELKQTLTDSLYANFDSFSLSEQADLLRNPTTAPERPLLLALVRKMALRYQEFPQTQSMEAVTFNRVAGDALVQWYALDPDGARPAILKEILRPKPRFTADVLGILPEKQLPEVEQSLLANFAASTDRSATHNLAGLIARYVSAAPEADLVARLDRDLSTGICETQAPLLAWLLRAEPDQAAVRLEKLAKPGNVCRVSLTEIGKLQSSPLLESLALKALDEADTFAVSDAASYLTDNGSAGAEDPLWSHLAAWSKRWTGQEAQLNASGVDIRIGQSLMQALLMGNGWLMDAVKLKRLSDLAVVPALRQQAEQYRAIWQNHPWLIRAAGYGQYQIGWYHAVSIVAAKRKMEQFPRGTEFRWIMQGLPGDSMDFKELARFGAEHGIRLW